MYSYIVDDIHSMLHAAASNGEPIEIAALIWSIDARHRLIPDLAELNAALDKLGSFEIDRSANPPCIVASTRESQDRLNEKDYDRALNRTNAVISGSP